MTVKLELNPEVEITLLAQAEARGFRWTVFQRRLAWGNFLEGLAMLPECTIARSLRAMGATLLTA